MSTGVGSTRQRALLRERGWSALGKGHKAPLGAARPAMLLEQANADGRRQIIRCASCRHVVTSSDAAIEVDGAHEHVHTNPAGFVFEIGCFRDAPGCAAEGPASEEWSWFPGYAWQVGLCVGCGVHLGWVFVLAAGRFYGLIVDRLVADEGPRGWSSS
jgi:hypothetical protein